MRRQDRHWREQQANGEYARSKLAYEKTAAALAEAVLEHQDLTHVAVKATLEDFRVARIIWKDTWELWKRVQFK